MTDRSSATVATQRILTLRHLPIGATAVISQVGGGEKLRQHLLDMGIIPGAAVTMVKHAPMGDPVEVRTHGYELTLRLADCDAVEVLEAPECAATCPANTMNTGCPVHDGRFPGGHPHETEHPGLGETGRFHDSTQEHPLPVDQMLTFALVGNQNSGKTTLFNRLTGSNLHVGNFPGVTMEAVTAQVKQYAHAQIADLPGIYSLSPYSAEELLTREFIITNKPEGIINIVDATNLERNLYLTTQLLELGVPMVLALNMMDEVSSNKGSILVNQLESMLGIPVVPISALNGQGIDELMAHALHVAHFQERPEAQDLCACWDHNGAVHRCIHGIMHLIEDHCQATGIPVRFAASKLAEGDDRLCGQLGLDSNEIQTIEHIVVQMEHESGLDRRAALASMRYGYIDRVCAETVVRPQESAEHARSKKIDQIVTGKWTGIPTFIAVMALTFYLTFSVFGAWLQGLLEEGIGALGRVVESWMMEGQVNDVVQSLVMDGIFSGVGSVVSFLPIIVVLFFFLSILEDSGYMARVAFLMDKPLRRLGLSGRSIVPMLIGFGCSVPAIMASRSLPSERDRRMTVLLTPFMSCSAKLPVYAFLCAAFFPDYAGLVLVFLYVLGVSVGILCAAVMKRTLFRGEAVPFVMELPNYRLPDMKNVGHLLWDKAWDFLKRAFSVIFLATLVIWVLQTFSPALNVVADSSESILAHVAGVLAGLFAPLGFGDWRIVVALISGFMQKEAVIGSLSVLFGSAAGLAGAITPLAGLSLAVFCLLYTPCIAAIASVRKELGGGWALAMVVAQCAIAWLVAALVRVIGLLVGLP